MVSGGILLFFLSLTSGFSSGSEQQVVVHARLEKSLFLLASTAAKKIIGEEVPKIPLPPINEKMGGIRVKSRWARWDSFDAPRTNFSISSNGLRWETEGGEVKIKINFVAKWLFFTKVGIVDFTGRDLRTSVQAILHNVNSRPQIEVKHCAIKVGRVSVHVHAQITGFFINLFSKFIENSLGATIRSETCKMITRLVSQSNKFVMDQPEEIRIWNTIALNYSLIGQPSFRSDAIEASSAFRFTVGNISDDDEERISSFQQVVDDPRVTLIPHHFFSLSDFLLYSTAAIGALNLLVKRTIHTRK
ncbi:hypothetical protein PMAYCL1PPCAC_29911 [Pristionchus mayeri]|uniref:Lipid-binding serum glycoprotein N-terminal domain-containing protein n=1 Tax=Pristionchus mayeri TaxID=1317129 RepID=A0AAN5IEL7_9BILA|nr:hypothetical protein PMAYCL1PPCAC_29911 [Pristionchus mayeri]